MVERTFKEKRERKDLRDEGHELALLALRYGFLEGLHLVGVGDLVGNQVGRAQVHLHVVLRLHTPLDAEHLAEGVFVAMVHLKFVPGVPE